MGGGGVAEWVKVQFWANYPSKPDWPDKPGVALPAMNRLSRSPVNLRRTLLWPLGLFELGGPFVGQRQPHPGS